MQQVMELPKTIAELIGAIVALVAPFDTIVVAANVKGEPHRPSIRRWKRENGAADSR